MSMLRTIFRECVPEFVTRYYGARKTRRRLEDSVSHPLVKSPEREFERAYHIKDETWEKVHVPPVFRVSAGYELSQFHPSQDILVIPGAVVSGDSDIISTAEGVVWDKFYSDTFTKTVPLDVNLVQFDAERVAVRKPAETVAVSGRCLSLFGVHATVWSHFLVQFLPKLHYAEEAGLLDRGLTVLLPDYEDKQVRQLVDDVLRRHPTLKVIRQARPDRRITYRCEELLYVPTASTLVNHAEYIAPFDFVIPRRVVEVLKKNVVEGYAPEAAARAGMPERLYLVRRGTHRCMRNWPEVEAAFEKRGFRLVEPHLLTLEEKAGMFASARVIAGPLSSAFTNLMFCRNAKCLLLQSMSRTADIYIGAINGINGGECLEVTGADASSSIHTDYTIPVERVEAAYALLMGGDEGSGSPSG